MPRPLSLAAMFAAAMLAVAGPAAAAASEADIAAVWAREDAYWRATVSLDNRLYQSLWHPDFRGWPCGEPQSLTGKPPVMAPDRIRRSFVMDKKAATGGRGIVSTFYHVRLTETPPHGKAKVTDYEITHTWVPTRAGWQILSGMCR